MKRKSAPIEDIKELSKVSHPTMLVVSDASGESLNACIVFVRAGDSTSYAEELAEGDLRSPRIEQHLLTLPDDFDAERFGLYWDQVYSG